MLCKVCAKSAKCCFIEATPCQALYADRPCGCVLKMCQQQNYVLPSAGPFTFLLMQTYIAACVSQPAQTHDVVAGDKEVHGAVLLCEFLHGYLPSYEDPTSLRPQNI